ncbi:hypothetical protein GCM10027053_23290 [Intrasporangium mesophilum]
MCDVSSGVSGTSAATLPRRAEARQVDDGIVPRPRNRVCLVFGHLWQREHQAHHVVLLTCRRCGYVDAVDKDMDMGPWLG